MHHCVYGEMLYEAEWEGGDVITGVGDDPHDIHPAPPQPDEPTVEDLTYQLDKLRAAFSRAADSRELWKTRALEAGWTREGPRPDAHRAAQRHLKADWPTLAYALEALVRHVTPPSQPIEPTAPAIDPHDGPDTYPTAQPWLKPKVVWKPITVRESTSVLGEGFHTAFRKGVDSQQAWEFWRAIDQLPREDWHQALQWLVWSLNESGMKICHRKAQS